MLSAEVLKLKNIHIEQGATIRSYRYNAIIEYKLDNRGFTTYHPNCITDNYKYLIDYSNVCKDILTNIDAIRNIENQEHKFMVTGDIEQENDVAFFISRLNVKIYNIADLTFEQAQQIINNNVYLINQVQTAINEQVLINKINKTCK